MHIRAYEASDLTSVVTLFTASVHGLADAHYDADQCEAWAPRQPDMAAWRDRLRALRLLLAVDGDALAGFIGYEDDGHIDLLFTAPAQARSGVATRLYARAESMMLASGASLLTTEASELARPFFARQGFSIVETQVVQRHGVSLRRYAMRKEIR